MVVIIDVVNHYLYIVYCLINKMFYVGRRTCYCDINDDSDYLGSGTFITKAIENYGKNNFTKTILCTCNTYEELLEAEKAMISKLDAVNDHNYYNIAPGGESRPNGFKMSESEKEKVRYLNKMMNEEYIYGIKPDDNLNDKDRDRKVQLIKVSYGKEYITLIIFDDKNQKNMIGSCSNTREFKYDFNAKNTRSDWLHKKNYMIISKEEFERYQVGLISSCISFYNVRKEIVKKHEEYFKKLRKNKNSVNIVCSIKAEEIINGKSDNYKDLDNITYIKEMAKTSNDYMNVSLLIDSYKNKLGFTVIYHALTGKGSIPSNFKNTVLKCSDDQFKKAEDILSYELKFKSIVKKVGGRNDRFYMAIAFCFMHDDIDNDELYERLDKYCNKIKPIKTIDSAIKEIDELYNYRRNKNDKVDIYLKYLSEK